MEFFRPRIMNQIKEPLGESNPFGLDPHRIAVGIAHSDYVQALVRETPSLIDYVEIPFEQLLRTPSAIEIRADLPVILHCASLSLAGNVRPSDDIADRLTHWVAETGTPWVGEHLAYVTSSFAVAEASPHEPILSVESESGEASFNVGFTVSPQYSRPVLDRLRENLDFWRGSIGVPLLLENGPIYVETPGSTMSQGEFLQAVCAETTADLLLDLSHLLITCHNLGWDPFKFLLALPLSRVVEVHLSGTREEGGLMWDDHARSASDLVFGLLEHLLTVARPRAVTLEYNWDANFPRVALLRDIERTRGVVREAGRHYEEGVSH